MDRNAEAGNECRRRTMRRAVERREGLDTNLSRYRIAIKHNGAERIAQAAVTCMNCGRSATMPFDCCWAGRVAAEVRTWLLLHSLLEVHRLHPESRAKLR